MRGLATALSVALRSIIGTRAAADDPIEPSGVQLRLTPWFPIAQSEDQDSLSPFPPAERLYPARMQALVRNFDPVKYRPPVILGTACADPGPAHAVGEYNEPAGYVVGLEWDGLHLWARAAELQDPESGDWRISEAVACGHLGRSIGFWIAAPAADSGFQLRHLALLSGEPEGQMAQALPPLSNYFRSVSGAAEAVRAEAGYRSSNILWPPEGPQEDDMPMTEAELAALLDRIGTRTSEIVSSAVATSVAPLNERLTALGAELTAARAEIASSQRADREAGYRTELEGAVRAGQLDPGELEVNLQTLMELNPERSAALLKAIKARRVSPLTTVPLVVRSGEGEVVVDLPSSTDSEGARIALETEAAIGAGSAASDDPTARYERTVEAMRMRSLP